jgi:hypothetical protein
VVRDVERSLRFYRQVFGVEEYGRTEGLVHTRTPGCQDVITFDEQASGAGESRGIAHFGYADESMVRQNRIISKKSRSCISRVPSADDKIEGKIGRNSPEVSSPVR